MENVDPSTSNTEADRLGSSASPLVEHSTIGRYIVLRLLGEGAMGRVFAAYDMELDRKVAVKVLRADVVSANVRERTLREAKALAKLSHPNVVQVYDVGEHKKQLYMALEYIEGHNLREWRQHEDRSWRQIVDVILEIGRGLQAAHAIGLVHRDVKPDNILVGSDGRARIADFGLVRAILDPTLESGYGQSTSASSTGDQSTPGASSQGTLSGSQRAWGTPLLTQAGRAIGTPAYMAPEQHLGFEVDARTDQFGICASLYETLYGVRPFTGPDVKSLRKQAINGEVRPPPTDSEVPRWIERALLRGLKPNPDDRWPSLEALLDALRRDPGRRWRWRGAVVLGLALLAGGSYALAAHQARVNERCTGAAQEIAEVWEEQQRGALAAAFSATADPLATPTLPRVMQILDAYADDWTSLHNESCRAHRRGESSPMLLDRTMACLRRRKGELAALVEVLTEAEEGTIGNAVRAAHHLPRLASCAESEALLATTPPPDDPEVLREVETLRGELGRVRALQSAGRYDDAIELVTTLAPKAKRAAYLPLSAEVQLREGSLRMWQGDPATAAVLLRDAFASGLRAKADRLAVEALAQWIYCVGYGLERVAEVETPYITAMAMADRIPDSADLRALIVTTYASAKSASTDVTTTLSRFRRALELWRSSAAPERPRVAFTLFNIGSISLEHLLCDEAEQAFEEALLVAERTLGAEHSETLFMLLSRCAIHACRGGRGQAIACYHDTIEQLPRYHNRHNMFIADVIFDTAKLYVDSGNFAAARRELVDLQSITGTDDSTINARALGLLGWIELYGIEFDSGDLEAASQHFEQSAAIYRRLGVPASTMINTQAGLAEIELARRQSQDARNKLKADLDQIDAGTMPRPWKYARARFTLARILASTDSPATRIRGRNIAGEARAALKKDRTQDGLRTRIEAWIDIFDRAELRSEALQSP